MINGIGYARISRDEDKENYSSIESQQLLIYQYASKNGINVKKIYIDDNKSGYTFERAGMKKVRAELKNPDIHVVIAKDLSRIGRHNALTLLFIDEVKAAGKRLVLPDESSGGFDSSKDDDDIIGIKTWFNERYVKDISRKIRSSMKSRQENGTLIIRPFFGYKVDGKHKKLVVDEETAFIVREIFKMYLEGYGYRKISAYLNERKYMTPSMVIADKYNASGRTFKNKVADFWSDVHICRILKNDVYIGILRLGKTRKPGIKTKPVKVSPEEQFVFENAHEALVSKEDFEAVQRLAAERDTVKFRGTGSLATKNNNVFSGLLFCGDCGEYMVTYSPKGKKKSYVCSSYHRRGKDYCSRHRVAEDELICHIKNHLTFLKENLLEFICTLDKEVEKRLDLSDDHGNLVNLQKKRFKVLKEEYKTLLSQKVRDMNNNPEFRETIEENYKEMELEKLQKIKAAEEQMKNLEYRQERMLSFPSREATAAAVFDRIIREEIPGRYNLELTVKRMDIFENNIEVHLNEDIDLLCVMQAYL